MANRWGNNGNSEIIFLGSKITADGDCSYEIKRCLLLGRKAMTNLDSIVKSRDITLPTKVHLVKAMVFMLAGRGVEPEQRVIIALPDGPEFVAAFFGTLKLGAVVVMVNPQLAVDAIEYFYSYTRAAVALVHRHTAPAFQAARSAAGASLKQVLVVGETATTRAIEGAS